MAEYFPSSWVNISVSQLTEPFASSEVICAEVASFSCFGVTPYISLMLFLLSNGIVKNKGSANLACNFGGRTWTVYPRGHTGIWLGQANAEATAGGQRSFIKFYLFQV